MAKRTTAKHKTQKKSVRENEVQTNNEAVKGLAEIRVEEALHNLVDEIGDPNERFIAIRETLAEAADGYKDSDPDLANKFDELVRKLSENEKSEINKKAPAASVASVVNLQDIFIEECSARRTPEGASIGDVNRAWSSVEKETIGRLEAKGLLYIKLPFLLRVQRKISDLDDEEALAAITPAVEIRCRFVLVYAISSYEELSDENLAAFAQSSGVFSAWPYWREFVHSASLRLSISPIVLPTYRN